MKNNDNSSSSSRLGRPRRRLRRVGDATDRLSHLPDFIIHHILSFLETKCAVRTSVLSRVWRSAWKNVPVLKLLSGSFQRRSSFESFVDHVLSQRHPFNVRSVTYAMNHHAEEEDEDENEDEDVEGEKRRVSQFVEVIKYALSHDTQHLDFQLQYVMDEKDSYRFSDLFGTDSNCNLKTLELGCVHIDSGFGSSGFQVLTTLKLTQCLLASDRDGEFDPFSNFPSLKNLLLSHCRHMDSDLLGHERHLKISGPQLLSLELVLVSASNMEIFAPRLEFLRLEHDLEHLKFSKLSFPALHRALVLINDEFEFLEGNEERVKQGAFSLFQSLSNITTLMLDSRTIEDLSSIFEFLEQQASPFTRLKTVMVKGDIMPYILLNYFLKGSSGSEPAIEFV